MTEGDFQRQVIKAAEMFFWAIYHVTNVKGRLLAWSSLGFPDLVLCHGHQVLYRELKTDTGRLSTDQKSWIALLNRAGQDVGVWRPKDWDRVVLELKGGSK